MPESKKYKQKLVFVDQTSIGDHHMVFNGAISEIFCKVYPQGHLYCYGTDSSQSSLKRFMPSEVLAAATFVPIRYPKTPKSLFLKLFVYPIKEVIRYRNFKKIFKSLSKDDVLLLSITTFTSFYLFRRMARKSEAKLMAVLHGDMDYVYKTQGIVEKLNGWVHKCIMRISPQENFRYITLNKVTKPILVSDGWLGCNDVFDIYHPIMSEFENIPFENKSDILRLGHIGSMEVRRKGSQLLYTLAEMLKEEKVLSFVTLGLISPSVYAYKNEYVEEIVGNTADGRPAYLSREKYVAELKKLDYAVLFYPADEYVMRASGALSDILDFLIPIVALKHPYLAYYQKKYGEIGYLCKDLEEMKSVLVEMKNNPKKAQDRRKVQVANLLKIKENSAVDAVAEELRLLMKKTGW